MYYYLLIIMITSKYYILVLLSKLQEIVKDRGDWYATQSMGSQRVRPDSATEQQQ